MGTFQILFIFAIIIISGQVLFTKTKGNKIFFGLHFLSILIIVFISIIITNNQTGGVDWPWWVFSLFYLIPIIISLIIGVFRKML